MSEQKSFFTTLPGILTALAGLVTAIGGLILALNQIGIIGSDSSKIKVEKPAEVPKQSVPPAPKTPEAQTTDGWAIIGFYERGKFSDLKVMAHGDSPAIGRSYDVVENFRLVQQRPEKGQAVITLGMVHPGGSVEVLDIEIAPGTSKVPVWAKLRAVLHPVKAKS